MPPKRALIFGRALAGRLLLDQPVSQGPSCRRRQHQQPAGRHRLHQTVHAQAKATAGGALSLPGGGSCPAASAQAQRPNAGGSERLVWVRELLVWRGSAHAHNKFLRSSASRRLRSHALAPTKSRCALKNTVSVSP